jgi:predicted Zn finger-like uncharacterized protein
MPEIVSCPKCARQLRVPDDLLGKNVKCPACSATFTAAGEKRAAVPRARPVAPKAEQSSFVAVSCPMCQKQMRVPSGDVGDKVKCPGCATVFTSVPDRPKASVPPPKPAPKPSAEDFDSGIDLSDLAISEESSAVDLGPPVKPSTASGGQPEAGTSKQNTADRARLTPQSTPAAPARTFAPGDALPGLSSWVLEKQLGGGGFGQVWLAKHEWKNERRAVKFCLDPTAKHRLVTHEKKVIVRVMKYTGNHPNIVPLLECNLDGNTPWLMYEFVEGGTLADAIGQWKALDPAARIEKAVRTLHGVAGALGAFHKLVPPIIHRDMKPHNVLMQGDVPRVTDFGIGGAAVEAAIANANSTRPHTEYSVGLPSILQNAGTRLYAPPEQMFGSAPNPRDDVYALGVMAYQMFVGELRYAPGTDDADELRGLKVPDDLIALVTASVAQNPDRRPKDATEWHTRTART